MRNAVFTLISLILTIPCHPAAGRTAWFEPGECVRYNSELEQDEVPEGAIITINVVADFPVIQLVIGAITVANTDASIANNGVAGAGSLNAEFTEGFQASPGVHEDGTQSDIVIHDVSGEVRSVPGENVVVDAGEPLYSFAVQAGAAGTTIIIDDLMVSRATNPYGDNSLATLVADFFGWAIFDIKGP